MAFLRRSLISFEESRSDAALCRAARDEARRIAANIAKLPDLLRAWESQRTYVFLTNSWHQPLGLISPYDFACVRQLEEHAAVATLVAFRRTLIFGVRLAHLLLRRRR